jgi:hypothetical protein
LLILVREGGVSLEGDIFATEIKIGQLRCKGRGVWMGAVEKRNLLLIRDIRGYHINNRGGGLVWRFCRSIHICMPDLVAGSYSGRPRARMVLEVVGSRGGR